MSDPGALAIICIFGLPMAIGALATWMHYRNEALKLKAKAGGAEDSKLAARVEALERQCAKLQEQVNEAHALLTDERRLLDHKLAAMLPDAPAPSAGDEATRQKAAQRVRE